MSSSKTPVDLPYIFQTVNPNQETPPPPSPTLSLPLTTAEPTEPNVPTSSTRSPNTPIPGLMISIQQDKPGPIDHELQTISAQHRSTAVRPQTDEEPNQNIAGSPHNAPVMSSSTQSHPHPPEPPKHNCLQCGKSFKRAHNLKIHARVHTGERPYSCPFQHCRRDFKWKSSYQSHIAWHTDKNGDILPPTALTNHSTQPHQQTNHLPQLSIQPIAQQQETNHVDPNPLDTQSHKQDMQQSYVNMQPTSRSNQPLQLQIHEPHQSQQMQMLQARRHMHQSKMQMAPTSDSRLTQIKHRVPTTMSIARNTLIQDGNHIAAPSQSNTEQQQQDPQLQPQPPIQPPWIPLSQASSIPRPQARQIQQHEDQPQAESQPESSKKRKRTFVRQPAVSTSPRHQQTSILQQAPDQKRARLHILSTPQNTEKRHFPESSHNKYESPHLEIDQHAQSTNQTLQQNSPAPVIGITRPVISHPRFDSQQCDNAPEQGNATQLHALRTLRFRPAKNHTFTEQQDVTTKMENFISVCRTTTNSSPICPITSNSNHQTLSPPSQTVSVDKFSRISDLQLIMSSKAGTVEQPVPAENVSTNLEKIIEHSLGTDRGRDRLKRLYLESDYLAEWVEAAGGLRYER